jgi:hypothetical protein
VLDLLGEDHAVPAGGQSRHDVVEDLAVACQVCEQVAVERSHAARPRGVGLTGVAEGRLVDVQDRARP